MNARIPDSRSDRENGLGLRLRIWFGCLAGALVAAVGVWLVVLWFSNAAGSVDTILLWVWLPAAATAGILVGLAVALWLDHGIVTPLRAFLRGIEAGSVEELRGIPSASGWGEISALTQELQNYLTHHRETTEAARVLERLETDLDEARVLLARWLEDERWESLPSSAGALGPVSQILNEGHARDAEVREQNQAASNQVLDGLLAATDDARNSAEQTERGFVEATALLTTVRELRRLAEDLDRAGASLQAPFDPAPYGAVRDAASQAIDELVRASSESVGNLSTALLRVREIGDQVQVMGNRATLLALNVFMTRRTGDEGTIDELKTLSREVRFASDRAAACTEEVEREVARASERMESVRVSVAEALDAIPDQPMAAPAASMLSPDLTRLMDRIREMVQDAASKGERLSSAGERASRAAERLVRRLEETAGEIEGLVIRLGPVVKAQEVAAKPAAEPSAEPEDDVTGARDAGLRLLGRDEVEPRSERRREDRP
jgi:hypothetical protein